MSCSCVHQCTPVHLTRARTDEDCAATVCPAHGGRLQPRRCQRWHDYGFLRYVMQPDEKPAKQWCWTYRIRQSALSGTDDLRLAGMCHPAVCAQRDADDSEGR